MTVQKRNGVQSAELVTDRAGERVRVQRARSLSGVEFWSVNHSQRHWSMHHDTFTACLVLGPTQSMHAKWRSRGRERHVAAGALQLMEPGETHRTVAVSEPASFFVVWWSRDAMASLTEDAVSEPLHFREAQLEDPDVSRAFRSLHDAVNYGDDPLAVEDCHVQALSALLERAAERAPQSERFARHPNVRRAIEYLGDCYPQTVSLDTLARESGLSKFHLARCFRESTGLPPHQYQKLLRIQAARRLIERGVTVRDAAARVGFADGSHLTRTFRDWLGVPPSEWARARR